jgi:transcriptional regulator NrdR family protein
MTDNNSEDRRVVERRFCVECNREVPGYETAREQLIVVNGDQVVEIRDRLRHVNCGGILVALKLQSNKAKGNIQESHPDSFQIAIKE